MGCKLGKDGKYAKPTNYRGQESYRAEFLVFDSPLYRRRDKRSRSNTPLWLGTGPKAHKLEEMFKEYEGSKYVVALNS